MKYVPVSVPRFFSVLLVGSLAVLAGCGGPPAEGVNNAPLFSSDITQARFDGQSDDLLTGGLGKSGLESSMAPTVANPDAPSAAELRRLAMYTNYRAMVDTSAAGGFGILYGPNIDSNGRDTLGEGKIAGREFSTLADDGSGKKKISLLLQVPDSFNSDAACLVAAPSSGSRGVYGALATAGEWGLKHGCAVVYTDKGTGNAVHDLQNNTVTLADGRRGAVPRDEKLSTFTVTLSEAERVTFNQATPNRFAIKHAHSQQNPEKDWGQNTLQAIDFAFYILNELYGKASNDGKGRLVTLTSKNTLVIAASVSNGGGAVLAAAEQDSKGLISGVVAGEPNVQLPSDANLTIARGNTRTTGGSKPLYDYLTLANLLQPCAALDPTLSADAPFKALLNLNSATARCNALRKQGIINGNTTAELASASQAALLAAGYQPESRELHAAMYLAATSSVVTTYGNALGRFSVRDNLCGLSFGGEGARLPLVYGLGNGIPPMTSNGIGIAIINNNSVGGALPDPVSISAGSGVRDYNFDGAFCQRELATGSSANAVRVKAGIVETSRNANLQGKPAIIVHGRADTLIPVNFSSRPYFSLNKVAEGAKSRLSYIEVTNGQHFDAFLAQAGFDQRYIPLHVYFNQALDMLYANLKNGAALPASQLVRTTARGLDSNGKAKPLQADMLPAIKTLPAAPDTIIFNNNVLTVPD